MNCKLFTRLAGLLLAPVLFSCASYHRSMDRYYTDLREHNYEAARHSLEHNKLIKRDRNALLYNLEMGKLYRLQNNAVSSNIYFNRADDLMDAARKNAGDLIAGDLINPMHARYRGEDFEQYMVHFYKALNYAALSQTDDAVVEARRITLSENTEKDKFRGSEKRYCSDAFALNLQGMIYEMSGDVNNAFISYRNAAELYERNAGSYYGVAAPAQLHRDLLRTALLTGFHDEAAAYEAQYGIRDTVNTQAGGELILFFEEGSAPVKEEADYFLTTGKNGIGSFNYIDESGVENNFNFNFSSYGIGAEKLTDLRGYRLALPHYLIRYPSRQNIVVSSGGTAFPAEPAEDINNIAVNLLKERFATEMANALARQLTKKLIEKGTAAAASGIAKAGEKKSANDSTQTAARKEKSEQNAQQAGEVAGFVANLINNASEKADTRNWQSLPAFISYVRIPLAAGINEVAVSVGGRPVLLQVGGGKGLQMMSINVADR